MSIIKFEPLRSFSFRVIEIQPDVTRTGETFYVVAKTYDLAYAVATEYAKMRCWTGVVEPARLMERCG